jgi:hypothetical protein
VTSMGPVASLLYIQPPLQSQLTSRCSRDPLLIQTVRFILSSVVGISVLERRWRATTRQ